MANDRRDLCIQWKQSGNEVEKWERRDGFYSFSSRASRYAYWFKIVNGWDFYYSLCPWCWTPGFVLLILGGGGLQIHFNLGIRCWIVENWPSCCILFDWMVFVKRIYWSMILWPSSWDLYTLGGLRKLPKWPIWWT